MLDCFCGTGTTAAVAEKLGRRWIACDLGRFAIHTTRKRLLGIPDVKPFVVQNLGKYERQAWQAAEFARGDATRSAPPRHAYRRFILDLYRAQPHRRLHLAARRPRRAAGPCRRRGCARQRRRRAQIATEFWKARRHRQGRPEPTAWTCSAGTSPSS